MHNRELQLLRTVKLNNNLSLYENEINKIYKENLDKLEKERIYKEKLKVYEEEITVLINQKIKIEDLEKSKNYPKNIEDYDGLKDYFKLIPSFNNLYQLFYKKYSNEKDSKIKNNIELSKKLNLLTNFHEKYDSYTDMINNFEVVYKLYQKGCNINLNKITDPYQIINTSKNEINDIIKQYSYFKNERIFVNKQFENMISKLRSNLKSIQDYRNIIDESISFLNEQGTEVTYKEAQNKLNKLINKGRSILSNYQDLKKDFPNCFIKFFSGNYIPKIEKLIKSFEKDYAEVTEIINKEEEKTKKINKFTIILCSPIILVLLIILGATIINIISSYIDSIGVFFGILFGIIVGALYGAIRVVSFVGYGSLWWPGIFETMFPSVSYEVIIIINGIVLFLILLMIILGKIFVYKIDRFPQAEFSFWLLFSSTILLVFRVIWGGILSLIYAWENIYVINAIFGLFVGIFQVIMLVFGAGFWWPGLYEFGFMNGLICNIFLYGLIGVSILFYETYNDLY